MQTKTSRKYLPWICGTALRLCIVLIVAIALFTTGCGKKTDDGQAVPPQEDDGGVGVEVRGEGSLEFTLAVVDREGNKTRFEIHTDKETVGEALEELGLIAGEEGEYGLFVKTVNGITADYDKDGVYWAFYINGEYALTGIDVTEITQGNSYSLKVE